MCAGSGAARADDDPPPRDDAGELIEVSGEAPVPPGTISIDARVARDTPGALGEPFRVLSLLPGVTTSVAASGYPIVRGTLPGESRFTFDEIEIPMLYHLFLGNQVIHPSWIGDLTLRAGGHGAEHGHLLGGAIAMTPASIERDRAELRANPIELGAFVSRRLSKATSIAAAARAGTLAAPAKIYDTGASLYTVDQQTRLVHRLANGDQLTLTSIGAFDHLVQPDGQNLETTQLGFHRLDARWSRARAGSRVRAGVQSEFDTLRNVDEFPDLPPRRQGGRAYGARAYADGGLQLASWLTARGGVSARHRSLFTGDFPLNLGERPDPYLGLARAVDSEGAWSALDVRVGPVEVTAGVRADSYHAELTALDVRHNSVDPRGSIAVRLPNGARVEVAGGVYTAPPQVSVIEESIIMGPLPMADGAAANAGLSRAYQAQASLQVPLGARLRGDFAAYYRDTRYAVDFAMIDRPFTDAGEQCTAQTPFAFVYRDIDTRAFGAEAMIRGELARSVTGWVSYSLGKIDRDLGFVQIPHDFDQRHTLNATAQWRRGAWRYGATGHLHSGRPFQYPRFVTCAGGTIRVPYEDPTHTRRPPPAWRVDLRAERRWQFSGWSMTGYLEIQNASLQKEVIGYEPSDNFLMDEKIYEKTHFVPLPLVGVEIVL